MRLLVVEDDHRVGRALRQGFSEAKLECQLVRDGERGLELAKSQQFDAIVLDVLLPGRNGIEVLKELRGSGIRTPVILLTALGTVAERVAGLSAGADDYLVKPFSFQELMARLQAVCRRAGTRVSPQLEVGDLSLNLASRRLTRGGKEILITPTEFSLIEFLMRHAGQIVSRQMLCEAIWFADGESMPNVVEVNINRLRSKLDRGFEKPAIETIRGRGYVIRPSADAPLPSENGNDR